MFGDENFSKDVFATDVTNNIASLFTKHSDYSKIVKNLDFLHERLKEKEDARENPAFTECQSVGLMICYEYIQALLDVYDKCDNSEKIIIQNYVAGLSTALSLLGVKVEFKDLVWSIGEIKIV